MTIEIRPGLWVTAFQRGDDEDVEVPVEGETLAAAEAVIADVSGGGEVMPIGHHLHGALLLEFSRRGPRRT